MSFRLGSMARSIVLFYPVWEGFHNPFTITAINPMTLAPVITFIMGGTATGAFVANKTRAKAIGKRVGHDRFVELMN
jgi:hypothetical protein